MIPGVVTAFAIITATFAVWWTRIASNLYLLSAEIRQSLGRGVPKDDAFLRMAMVYLGRRALVMAAVAGALSCYAVVARPVGKRVPKLSEPTEPVLASPAA